MPSAEGLPGPPKAASWVEGNWVQVTLRLTGSPYPLGALAVGLLVFALFRLPGWFLVGWLLAVLVAVGVKAVLDLDAQNAAAPGWLASRSWYRWQRVDLATLSGVRKVSAEHFRLTDEAGGRAVLATGQENAVEVLNVIRRDLVRARKRGVAFPERLSALVDGKP
jgi:hypothetical protein